MTKLEKFKLYVTKKDTFKVDVQRLSYSGGIMTCLDIDKPKFRVRWDSLWTPAMRRQMKNASDKEFASWIVNHIKESINNPDRELSEWNIF